MYLDRPRHTEIIEELKKLNVNIKLITDGDVSGALLVTENKYKVDIFLGIVGTRRCLAAAVWTHLNGFRVDFYLKQKMRRIEQKWA